MYDARAISPDHYSPTDWSPDARPETGFIDAAIDAGSDLIDIIAGGPQKRERAAKAEQKAAEAAQKAAEANAQAELARLEQARLAAGAPSAPAKPSGIVSWAKAPGLGGLPNGVLVVGGLAAAFLAYRAWSRR